MDAVSNNGSSITDLMAMLRQLYHQSASTTASSSSSSSTSTVDQNAATATGVANSIVGSGSLSGATLTGASLMTLLQSQSFGDAVTTQTTGQITDAAYAKWAAVADKNGDGTISKAEFEAAVPSNISAAQADQLFGSIDTKGTGSVTAAQLRQGLAAAIAAGPVAAAPTGGTNQLFEALDTDGDGTLTQAEFEKDAAGSITQDQADAVFAALDPDGTGSITARQFGQALVDGGVASSSSSQSASGSSSFQTGSTASQTRALDILSELTSGGTTDTLSLLNGDASGFLGALDANQQSATSIQNSSSALADFLDSFGS